VYPHDGAVSAVRAFAVTGGGLAPVAGSVLAGYAQLRVPLEYLLAPPLIAAPAGWLMAKLVLPETGTPQVAAARIEQRGALPKGSVDA
jgi:CNT family concentrative nucleoside transporter